MRSINSPGNHYYDSVIAFLEERIGKTANSRGRIPRNRSVFIRSIDGDRGQGRAMPADRSLDGVRTGQSPPDIARGHPGGGGSGQSISCTMAENGELAARLGGRPAAAAASSDCGSPSTVGSPALNEASSSSSSVDSATRRRSNMTETIRVPTSEHVAEIVGRQGCKIKALRAKTNTYIKTPARGEEPVFSVTGRPEDVAEVKNEIFSAAEHFSQIRATRRSAVSGDLLRLPPSGSIEQVREKVTVPSWVVGLVVGPKGTTIRRIQQDTQTYIITPGREREPVFEIIGSAENVARARQEIESYIALRMKPRQSYASLNGWTKLDHRLNELTLSQHQGILRNSSHLDNSSCLLDREVSKEVGIGQSLQNERNWRHSSGFLSRPVSVDVGEFFRHFPTCQNLSFLREHFEKPQLEIEAILSSYLSDLNLISHDILKSFVNQESNLCLADLKPHREQGSAGSSRMPFAMKSALEDGIDGPLDSSTSFYTSGGSPSQM